MLSESLLFRGLFFNDAVAIVLVVFILLLEVVVNLGVAILNFARATRNSCAMDLSAAKILLLQIGTGGRGLKVSRDFLLKPAHSRSILLLRVSENFKGEIGDHSDTAVGARKAELHIVGVSRGGRQSSHGLGESPG